MAKYGVYLSLPVRCLPAVLPTASAPLLPLAHSIATVSLATCTASRQDVIIKQYTKKDMTPSQIHKMLREVRGAPVSGSSYLAASRGEWLCRRCAPSPAACPLQTRVMHMVKGEAGVAHILGDFEDELHHYIVMVSRGAGR